jgi:tripartite-type tricarboxylate transporter receptor subunit TctC
MTAMFSSKFSRLVAMGVAQLALALGFATIDLAGTTFAQSFPSRPMTLIVPFPAGGNADVGARAVMQKMSDILGQSILVDNRSGAGGQTGANAVKSAPPDGYTFFLSNIGTHSINASLYSKLSYDPVKDFEPVTELFAIPQLFLVNPEIPAKTVADLVKLAKEKPGTINFASQGVGSGGHLLGEMLKRRAGIDIIHVPYRGTAQAMPDLMSNRVQMFFDGIPVAGPMVVDGKLRALAAMEPKRLASLPNVPTMAEAGYPGVELSAWFGLSVPAGTPKPVIDKLHDAAIKAMKDPDVKNKLEGFGFVIVGSTPEQYAAFMKSETEKWAIVVKESGAHAD